MANSLLDFVMSLVRDPDAAARYAEDPAQAIADAELTDVTSADVSGLIPVVSESLSTAGTTPAFDPAADGNVWASGDATAAFDAFGDHLPETAVEDVQSLTTDLIDESTQDQLTDTADSLVPDLANGLEAPPQLDEYALGESPASGDAARDFEHPVLDDHVFNGDGPQIDAV